MGLRPTRARMKMDYGDAAPVRSRSFLSVVPGSPFMSLTAGHTVVPRIVASSTQSRVPLVSMPPRTGAEESDHEASLSALLRD